MGSLREGAGEQGSPASHRASFTAAWLVAVTCEGKACGMPLGSGQRGGVRVGVCAPHTCVRCQIPALGRAWCSWR